MNPNKSDTLFSKNSFSPEKHKELIKSMDKNNCFMNINSHEYSNENQLVDKKNLDKNKVDIITNRSPERNLESKYKESLNTQEIKLSNGKNIGKIQLFI